MSDTGSASHSSIWVRYRPEFLWAIFAVANLWAIYAFPVDATIPFHFIWISLTILYGFRVWPPGLTLAILTAVMVTTTVAQLHFQVDYVELTEVPLMASMFLVMVWHARRRQQAVEDLQASAERERDFLRDASHTLRTPITVAQGHAELIQMAAPTAQIASDADIVLQELRNLSKVSDRILMLASADHDSYMRFEATSAADIVQRAADRWRAAAVRDWQLELTGFDTTIEADRDQLEIVLDALIENAVRHTTSVDTIRLSATHELGRAVIRIEDTGEGIPGEHLPHIFERFYGTGVGERRGTGLGLAIVRSIVAAHDGSVTIESEAGVGTSVEVQIPGRVGRAMTRPRAKLIPHE